ncbi:SafA/ExsA family spore coat assembly protein [Priestia filamentosa]
MKIHIVQKGDTLWKIAKKYGVDFEEIKEVNSQLSNPDMIMPGMKIKVPTNSVQIKNEMQNMDHPYKEMPQKQLPITEIDTDEQMPQQPQQQMPQMPQQSYNELPMMPQQPYNGPYNEAPMMPQQPNNMNMPPKKEMPMMPPKEMPSSPKKEMPMMPPKEMPSSPKKEMPKMPKMPKMKPMFPEIDVNNYYNLNVQLPAQEKPKKEEPKKEEPKKEKPKKEEPKKEEPKKEKPKKEEPKKEMPKKEEPKKKELKKEMPKKEEPIEIPKVEPMPILDIEESYEDNESFEMPMMHQQMPMMHQQMPMMPQIPMQHCMPVPLTPVMPGCGFNYIPCYNPCMPPMPVHMPMNAPYPNTPYPYEHQMPNMGMHHMEDENDSDEYVMGAEHDYMPMPQHYNHPVQNPYMPMHQMPVQNPYMPMHQMPVQNPYMPMHQMPVQNPYMPMPHYGEQMGMPYHDPNEQMHQYGMMHGQQEDCGCGGMSQPYYPQPQSEQGYYPQHFANMGYEQPMPQSPDHQMFGMPRYEEDDD